MNSFKMQMARSILVLTLGSTAFASSYVSENAKTAAARLGADDVIELSFEKGRSALSEQSRHELDLLIQDAVKKGSVERIKVAVWGDREYPSGKEGKATEGQRKLAKSRAESVSNYLHNGLNVSVIESYNMMERPNLFETTFHTSDSTTKQAIESSGAAPKANDDKGIFDIRSQASTALVFIKMKQ